MLGIKRSDDHKMLKLSIRTLHSERGSTSAEHAVLASLIAGVIIGAVMTLGGEVRQLIEPPLVAIIELTIQLSTQPII